VRYVGDGEGLCVGQTADPKEWIEVRLADFNAPELNAPDGPAAKAALERLALKREAVCTSERGRRGRIRSFDRVIARCYVRPA
jgi:endonuclease YncB( thermonuclease family)